MIFEFLIALITVIVAVYVYFKRSVWNFFEKKGIRTVKFGSITDFFMQKRHVNEIVKENYFQTEGEKVYGIFFLHRPIHVIRDPELLRNILVKDFDHFVDRQSADFIKKSTIETDEVWRRQMTNLSGEEWKSVRATFSPIFTSGKMKQMMDVMTETSQRLVEEIRGHAKSGYEFELKDVCSKFSMDTIASAAFGVDAKSFSNFVSPFVKHASSVFKRRSWDMLKFVLLLIPGMWKIMHWLGISIFKERETRFFIDVIRKTLEERKNNPTIRNDLINLMIEAMNGKNIKNMQETDNDKDQFDKDSELKFNSKKEFEELTIVGTAMVMLIAGYDTTGHTLSFACYELVKNPDILSKLQEEVDAAYEQNDDKIPEYSVLQTLPYLDKVIHETLRLHSPVGILTRLCVKDYKCDGFEIKKGQELHIPSIGIHMDPKYYPEPEKFNPEHFSKESKATRNPYTFLGFGQGPRSCIGMRFALLEAKVALAAIVRNFDLMPCAMTADKIILDPLSAFGSNKEGLWIKATERNL